MYFYNWTTLANGNHINYCIENSQTNNKIPYLIGGEYTPSFPDNCMIYGVGWSCFRCSLGYFKTSVTPANGIGANISKCIAKDTNYGGCANTSGS